MMRARSSMTEVMEASKCGDVVLRRAQARACAELADLSGSRRLPSLECSGSRKPSLSRRSCKFR